MGSADEYDITNPTTPIHNANEWKRLTPEDRRRMAVEFYYSMLGLCEKREISNCDESDAKFIAKVFLNAVLFCLLCTYLFVKSEDNQIKQKARERNGGT